LQDRTKVKALSEELENPNNSHRWRKLDGSDPGTHEMIQKIQALQKRLIAKTEEVVERDLLIQVSRFATNAVLECVSNLRRFDAFFRKKTSCMWS